MYIQRIVYDSSCNYHDSQCQPSIAPNAMFNLTKDYLYVISEEIATESGTVSAPTDTETEYS